MFRELSLTLNKKLNKTTRQAEGIFFTPKPARDALFIALPTSFAPKKILEPSFGSGEFLLDAKERWPGAEIFGVEYNSTIFDAFQAPPGVSVSKGDFCTWNGCSDADLILGNPPYMVTTKKIPECMSGRPNLYVEFIWKCFRQHLAPNGILAFVLPTSFLNSSYYQPMREILDKESTILKVQNLDASFYDTAQDTFLLVVQKSAPSKKNPFILHLAGNTYLNAAAERIEELLVGSETLKSLGFRVKTGTVVWNQVSHIEGVETVQKGNVQKGNLVSVKEGAVMLYYSGNLGYGDTVMTKEDAKKKQYIKDFCRPAQKGPAILVSRGYGNNYLFNFAVIPDDREFYAENHVNVITGPTAKLGRVINSLRDKKTSEFLKLFVGNGGLSKSELEEVLPVF